ncbi:hypothetical protein N7490_009608 [Penicillium lividum]|nr:hypothetical protein N7490_009608 [Penicillium lividum]
MRFGNLLASAVTLSSYVSATTINVLYRHDKHHDKHAIAAFHSSGQLIGYSCDHVLNSGSFAKEHVSFDVDDQAAGKISVGGIAYPIHSNVRYSGGPTCTRVYNHKMKEADCKVTMGEDFVGVPVASKEREVCFGEDFAAFDLSKGIHVIDTSNVDRLELL